MPSGHLGSGPMPGAPFINHQLHAMIPIHFAHRRPMIPDQRLHSQCFSEQVVPVSGSELERIALTRSAAIVMQRPTINGPKNAFVARTNALEELARPIQIASVWT